MSAPPSGSPDVMAVAIAPAALSDKQSPGDSVVRSLPQYGILPDTAIESMKTIAGFSHDEYQGEGSMRFSFNTRMCSWQEMVKKSIFLLPAIPVPEGENLSMSYLHQSAV